MKKLHIDSDPLLELIREVGKPIERDSAKQRVKPVDLTAQADSLRELIEHAKGAYQARVDELKDRHDRKYKKELDDNFDPDEIVEHDYSDVESEPRITPRMAALLKKYEATTASPRRALDPNSDSWAAHWELMYKPPEGNPRNLENKFNPGGPRPGYLRPVYELVKWWWEEKAKLGKFQPDFDAMTGPLFYDDKRYYFERFNSAARLLHLIVLECDAGYRIENSANLRK
jgi:hypothetical protein